MTPHPIKRLKDLKPETIRAIENSLKKNKK